ncbi:Chitin synthase, class 3 [Vermiconidia calcicola]|uniref:Chitin synthase, class 3 n=1 Tax=Vermiconidia calcicola TaxID=1690605 RepID=A0ACC3NR92_9PEZI|nr:Chitin synthase, class 3 [Vermiconidia calcicola]
MSSRPDPSTPRRSHRESRRHSGSGPHRQSSSSGHRRRRSSTTANERDNPSSPEQQQHTRRRSSQRRAPEDLYSHNRRRRSSAGYHQSSPRHETPQKPRLDTRVTAPSISTPLTTPRNLYTDRDPMLEAATPSPQQRNGDVARTRSLVRPERRRHKPDDPNFHYRQHAQNMNVMPSTTGVDPLLDEDYATATSEATTVKEPTSRVVPVEEKERIPLKSEKSSRDANKLIRKKDERVVREQEAKEERRRKIQEASGTPTLWGTYCHLVTFWCPNTILRCLGKKQKEQQRAWREKMGLVSIILLIMLFVGFLTFGFTATVCPAGGPLRLRVNHVGEGYMIFHGKAYDLTESHHPLARGISDGGNVLWDMDQPHGGEDGSFLFQNVNGACKGLITPASGSDVPIDSDGNLAWYFPCNTFRQDGTMKPNYTIPYYFGYGCHTSRLARENFYDLRTSGDVYFTWDDIRNQTRNLMVYNGDVLDLDLLTWFNDSQVAWPTEFDDIRNNPAVRGVDVSMAFATGKNKEIAQCFQDILKVGSIDTATVGCIASKVVLYVSLIFILAIVLIKFVLAVLFQWILCRKFAASKTSMGGDSKKRKQQIEDWSDDIYRPPPKMTDPASTDGGRDRASKRASFLPTTSRFTSPYAMERSMNKNRPPPTTMASQQSRTNLVPNYRDNRSEITLPTYVDSTGKPSTDRDSSYLNSRSKRYSSVMNTNTDASGPQGFIHESVVPQPPPEWQPFGFPLAHAICLVTAYSEGPEGIRTTLDSVAMTDYPNSHKLMFVVCDGIVHGKGEKMSTPDACLSMMKDHAVLPEEVRPFSYVAVASGSKRHNMAKIYSGFYDYGHDSIIPVEKQQRVPMIVVVKCGTPAESNASKPGNRGKRDSQVVLMSFLQKVMFDERMTELEYEMFNGVWKITGMSPDFYEICLMVDADTKVFPDSLTHMISAMVKDPEIMGLCGETKIANKSQSWVSMIQVFEYFISHHLAKSFESCFGGVTCLPGCFCMYRIKTPKGAQNYWVPVLANPDIVEHYSENVVDTLHKKNLLLLGEDRYLSTLMLKTFPKRKQVFVPQAVCKTTVPEKFGVLLSQRRRWINSTIHNLMELVLVRDLCGTFCFSMQFVVFIDLVGCVVLPAAISFTVYVAALGIKAAITNTPAPTIPLVLLALILGLPGVLIVITAHRVSYVFWMLIYLLSLPIWNLVLPTYAYWHFDDFSWGDTRQAMGEKKGGGHGEGEKGEFDSSKITMKRWGDFEQERRMKGERGSQFYGSRDGPYSDRTPPGTAAGGGERGSRLWTGRHERTPSRLGYEERY